jgi:guanylate kinase
MRGPLVILSGPSGIGKSTVVDRIRARGDLPLRQSVSVTTRAPRPGEREGEHYNFWDRARFEAELEAGGFLEWAQVHGNYYGTPRRAVELLRDSGLGVVMVIDVQGAEKVRSRCPDAVSIFLLPSRLDDLERRLRDRGTEDEASVQRRLANARRELERAGEYDYQVINDDLDTTVEQVHNIIEQQFGSGGSST